jgi:NADH:ubiquinone oxidoreductase subunit F (NADH-binding)
VEKIITRNLETPNSAQIDVYIAGGGYRALAQALEMNPEAVIDEVKASGLVGRGGAGFPTGLKWAMTRREADPVKYIVCNADEGEPGTFKDRYILNREPHLLIEAMAIAGYAIGSATGYVYIRGEYYREIETFEKALAAARVEGWLGDNIQGRDFSFDITVYRGAGSYVCGEETALLKSMEGERGTPTARPPFPAQSGFLGHPTALNNVETLAKIPWIVTHGGAQYANLGSPDSPGTKLFSLAGHVNKPGFHELYMGLTLGELIEGYGGGVKGEFKAALPGGVSSRLLTNLDTELGYRSVAEAGSMLGSASVIVINRDTDMVDVAYNTVDFFARESCGKCSVCREGTRQAREILSRLLEGQGRSGELELLLEVAEVMRDTANCGLGQAALNVTSSAIQHFGSEFQARIRD